VPRHSVALDRQARHPDGAVLTKRTEGPEGADRRLI
jgi:hypothetical protein